MEKITIICRGCGNEISVDEALQHQIKERFLAESKKKEAELAEREKLLIEAQKKNEEVLAQQLEAEKKKMWAIAQEKAAEKIKVETLKETQLLKEELEEKKKKLAEAQEIELKLRQERNHLEEEKKVFQLEKQRQLDEERAKIKEEAVKAYSEEIRLKDAEKDKRMADMMRQIEDLKRKAEQGSQQTQGEVLELEFENTLKAEFPIDEIAPVPKGINGADIIQKVHDHSGRLCGTIAWEMKRTKAWSEGWVQKLKDDQRTVKAEVAILVTQILPEGIIEAGPYNGIYVTSFRMALGLAQIVRSQVINLANTIALEEGRSEKKEVLYNYLCGAEFRGRIEAFIESSISMREMLEKEKRAYTKIWAEREKQIERIQTNMIGMYGDIKGIAGQALPQIKSLELPGEEDLATIVEEVAMIEENVPEAVREALAEEPTLDIEDKVRSEGEAQQLHF